jgi:Fe2+ transport system protein FeoA
MPLRQCHRGNRVCLRRICADEQLTGYLHGLGLLPGTELEIVSDATPFVIDVKGSRLALGDSMLESLYVG